MTFGRMYLSQIFWLPEGMVKDTNEKHDEKFKQQAYKVRKNVKKEPWSEISLSGIFLSTSVNLSPSRQCDSWYVWLLLGLQASLLVRHPDTGELFVNCDPQLIQLIRETEGMMKMDLPIPETARLLYLRRNVIRGLADELKVYWTFNARSDYS